MAASKTPAHGGRKAPRPLARTRRACGSVAATLAEVAQVTATWLREEVPAGRR